jgi:diguanylate cyclase (GGDEF)-like protein/PAS domain S-box-containing protein
LLLAAVATGAALAHLHGGLDFLERHLQDARSRLATRPASGEVVVVEIDSDSLDWLETWPWPRRYYADVLERLTAAGATAIAFDVDLSSTSSKTDDARFAEALAALGAERIALPVFRQFDRRRDGTIEAIDTAPLPRFRAHVSLAHVDFQPDRDGLIRRVEARHVRQTVEVPALGVWLSDLQGVPEQVVIDFGIDLGGIPVLSFADVLEGTFDAAVVSGRRVIVGATANELGDIGSVPRHRLLPGALIHALVFETLLQGRALREVGGLPIALATIALTMGFGSIAARLRLAWMTLSFAGCAVTIVGGATLLQMIAPLSVQTSGPLAGLLGAFGTALMHAARRKDSLLRGVVGHSFDAIITFDQERRIMSFNPAAERMFACSAKASRGLPLARFLLGANGSDGLAFLPSDRGPKELVAQAWDGRRFPVEVACGAMRIDAEWVGIAALRDITDRKAQEAKLVHLAMHDPLTGLANRSLLQDRAARSVAAARRSGRALALLLLDLDRFKEVNDTLGHQVGDEVLQQIGPRLQGHLRAADSLARLGGDEFAVLAPEIGDVRAACTLAERIVETLGQPFSMNGLKVEIGASIGIAMFPEHGLDANELLQRADVAMYAAKRNQLGFAVYNPEEDTHSIRRLTLQGELRQAIEQRQLSLWYQPKVDTKSARLVGLEALVRWPHPVRGMISPDEFIPFAEHFGLIKPLTIWALEATLRQQMAWRQGGLRIPIAVNVSVKSLQDATFPAQVRELLEQLRCPPGELHFEITESALMADPNTAMAVLAQLSGLGCKLSLDDFGTGYSSLAYLQRLPIDELKIDRSFVRALTRDDNAAIVVRSIVGLAHSLGLSVVAEGVESQATFDALRDLGCDAVQGFLLGRPMPADDVLVWIAKARSGQAVAMPRAHMAADCGRTTTEVSEAR